ncbi:MAG: ABC transporter permease [Spirochaetales bacterium]|jgi:ABC-2 type transport system permease protein|nr:ABC transporter permease [Exilispira sp.]NMC68050.1 ABC transporter permease [Spirochaetales bacterium]
MKMSWLLAKRDLNSIFMNSIIAPIILFIFFELSGFFFYIFLVSAQIASLEGFIPNMIIILALSIPIVVARAFPEERKNNTLELLYTSPVSDTEVYFGKFIAYNLFSLIMISPVIIYTAVLFFVGKPEILPLIFSLLGYILLTVLFTTISLLVSYVSNNQVVAAMVSWVVLLIISLIDWLKNLVYKPFFKNLISNLSYQEHLSNLSKGFLDLNALLYFLVFIGLIIYVNVTLVESKK